MHKQLSLLPTEPEKVRATCLGNLAEVLGLIAEINRAETGQHFNPNETTSSRQGNQFVRLHDEIPDSFRKARAWAEYQYSQIGSAMCEGCLGRNACPLRTYNSNSKKGPTPHIDPHSDDHCVLAGLKAWYAALKPNARKNIKNGRVTAVTIRQSTEGVLGAHNAAT